VFLGFKDINALTGQHDVIYSLLQKPIFVDE